ncbi:hypothetical protein MNBD_ALPHA12-1099 [hydrothermal vent metagenome]|uniref:DUF1674 domain-containing protein n=1 Tax=hydrothermal vent metagenome TaxID=652676 RepID=A0A3B0T7J2_9ZZZZ
MSKIQLPPAATTSANGKTAKLSKNAQNALLEAQARRQLIDNKAALSENERAGRGGLEPTRYDDWEVKGITSDF